MALGVAVLPAVSAVAKDTPPRPIVTGWLPYWTTNASIASMQANKDLLQEVSPFWYTLRPSANSKQAVIGTQVSASSQAALMAAAAKSGVDLWPTFTDSFPARGLAGILSKPAKRAKLVTLMVALAVDQGYAGLDLDFEKFAFSDGSSTWASTAPNWVTFVKELGTALHAKGKKLAATTPPLCSMSGACGGRNGYWVYDWKDIGPYIDRLRIMAYDYSFSSPGPIGPYPWAEAIVRYAVTQVPSGKVQLGVATYGREWVRRNANGSYLTAGACPKSLPSSWLSRPTFDAVTVPAVLAARGLTTANVKWNDTYKESYYRYHKVYKGAWGTCKVYREGWFDGAAAVVARAGLVAKYQIAGIAAWTIGGEDPGQWSALRSLARGIAPDATSVSTLAPTLITHGQTGTVTVTVRSQGAAVASVPVTLQWRDSGASTWQTVATGTTNASGTATWRRTVLRPGTFRAIATGTWDRAQGLATASTTRVRPVLLPVASSISVQPGGSTVLRARLKPKAGQQIVVQKRVHGRWVKYANAVIGRGGNPHLKVRLQGHQDAFRFKARVSSISARAYSSTITVHTP